VAEQRDSAAGVDAADAEDRGEGAPQGVRREVCDRRVPVGLEDLVGALSHRTQDDVQDVVGRVGRPVAGSEDRVARAEVSK
jgi:hypothetical protein